MISRIFDVSVIRKDGSVMKREHALSFTIANRTVGDLASNYDSSHMIVVTDDHGRVMTTFGKKEY